ncbi:TPA: YihA family ribosome biogenesis GTP-binding protein [Candidatus Sumerlaeota bacterium]|jgi:GTP-binding protein|nr:YihA family ribosome biogenesis GTP-binding protein [Candidatus Sumerlaeota bacterium]
MTKLPPWEIIDAEFVCSGTLRSHLTQPELPQVAFAGRSNVGKSSLLNALVRRHKLAHTSRAPGRTRLLNYFRINKLWYYVDLPGYGFAKAPKGEREKWGEMMEGYLKGNDHLRLVVVLLDSRREITDLDEQLVEFLHHNNVPFLPVLTKSDKLTKNELSAAIKRTAKHFDMDELGIRPIATSAEKNKGRDELLQILYEALNPEEETPEEETSQEQQ